MYCGSWQYDKPNGFGFYTLADGGEQIGHFKDDALQGFGVQVWSDQSKYVGFYNKGRKHGFFRCIKADGSCKMGFYKSGKIEEYVQYNADGTVESSEKDEKSDSDQSPTAKH